jgi:hypothetical protein
MHFTSFSLANYKSFHRPASVALTPGFNVVVGQNSVGKTAFLECLGLRGPSDAHRSLLTLPYPGASVDHLSRIEFEFVVSWDDLLATVPPSGSKVLVPSINKDSPYAELDVLRAAVSREIRVKVTSNPSQSSTAVIVDYPAVPSDRAFPVKIMPDGEMRAEGGSYCTGSSYHASWPSQLLDTFRSRVFGFRAERMNIGQSPIGSGADLSADATNLPSALLELLGRNPNRFERFNRFVSAVMPDITRVAIQPSTSNCTIQLWSIDPVTEREDLVIPLSASGTGVGQVLAILYVAVTRGRPGVVIIDEPQSFLHPGAVRKLLEILRQEGGHQYVIATHSPAALAVAQPATVIVVRKRGQESSLEVADARQQQVMRGVLAEVGARLSDVFGADEVLWVEGRTEEECFPLIVNRLLGRPLLGTVIVGVASTGDFDGKRGARHPEMIVDIYRRLSQGDALMPRAIGFLFDREQRSDRVRAVREGLGVRFLPRRMYENYLLNPAGIASVVSAAGGLELGITAAQVVEWLDSNRLNAEYSDLRERGTGEHLRDSGWVADVNGAAILQDCFSALSGGTVSYRKADHGRALTEWLIENDPAALDEVKDILNELLPASRSIGPDEGNV